MSTVVANKLPDIAYLVHSRYVNFELLLKIIKKLLLKLFWIMSTVAANKRPAYLVHSRYGDGSHRQFLQFLVRLLIAPQILLLPLGLLLDWGQRKHWPGHGFGVLQGLRIVFHFDARKTVRVRSVKSLVDCI